MMKEEVGKGWWDPNVLDAFEHLLAEAGHDFQSPHNAVEIRPISKVGRVDLTGLGTGAFL
jgi:hypothetical protein